MPAPIKELLHRTAPVAISVEGEGTGTPIETLIVKGFASVERLDRSGDKTSPTEFNVAEFMASPTLLLNHKYWIDHTGNEVAIGRILTMHPARLAKNENDPALWNVISLKTKEVINTYPKAKVPALKRGARGLFVTAEVFEQEVIDMVGRGELGSMSWRGLVEVDFELNPQTGESIRVLKNIDLFEVSLVHIPDNNQSTFIVGKTVGGKLEEVNGISLDNARLFRVELPKAEFDTDAQQEFLKNHDLKSSSTIHSDSHVVYTVAKSDDLDLDQTVKIKMAGAHLVMAPPKLDSPRELLYNRLVADLVGRPDQVDAAKSVKSPMEHSSMSDSTNVAVDDAAATEEEVKQEVQVTEVEESAEAEKGYAKDKKKSKMDEEEGSKTAKAKDAEQADDQLTALGTHITSHVVEALTPAFDSVAKSFETMGTSMATIVEKMSTLAEQPLQETETEKEPADESKAAVSKSAEVSNFSDVMSTLNGLAETLEKTQSQVVDVAKSAIALGASVPNAGVEREESVQTEVEKSAISGKDKNEDENSVLDGAFPWLAE